MNGKKKIRYCSVLAMIALMVGVAELTCEREIIFPEMAALTIGLWISDKHIWQVGNGQLILLMTLAAVAGVLIVRYSPLPYYDGIRYCGGDIDYATFDAVSARVGFDTTRATPHHKLGIPSVGIDYDHYHYYRQTHIRAKWCPQQVRIYTVRQAHKIGCFYLDGNDGMHFPNCRYRLLFHIYLYNNSPTDCFVRRICKHQSGLPQPPRADGAASIGLFAYRVYIPTRRTLLSRITFDGCRLFDIDSRLWAIRVVG